MNEHTTELQGDAGTVEQKEYTSPVIEDFGTLVVFSGY